MPDARTTAALAGAERFLNAWHGGPSMSERLEAVARATPADEREDTYGDGERIARLESRVAELVGAEAAVFMPTGTAAQQIALRIWTERKGVPTVAWHPTCHLEIHEQRGYQALHGLRSRLVGDPHALIARDELEKVTEPLAALLLELPQREIGGRLPEWEDLVAETSWARERDIAVHLDGARLWQVAPFYGRPYAEIGGLFDSVYVSFYKDLGALAGAALAGDHAFIGEARVWLRRHGGNLVTMHPFVVSAELGLDERLPRIPAYVDHARAIGAALAGLDGVEVLPDPPQTAMFHVLIRGDRDRLVDAALAVAEERKVFLFSDPKPTTSPTWYKHEVTVGECTLDLAPGEVSELYAEILERAAALPV
jgi:threonine aldolase